MSRKEKFSGAPVGGADDGPLDAEALRQRLEALVYSVLTVRRSVAGAAEALARFERAAQERFLASVELIRKDSIELAYNFCLFAPPALERIDAHGWHDWVLHILETYDTGGVVAAIVAMQKVDEYAAAAARGGAGVRLEGVVGVLEHFLHGLNGRPLKVVAADRAYTDTESVFLPPCIDRFDRREDNYDLYKATAVHLWAQTWYGTWRRPLTRALAAYDRPERALRLFHILETLRLDACIARDLPGLYRILKTLRALGPDLPRTAAWQRAAARLARPEARVDDSLALLATLYGAPHTPEPFCYQGVLDPKRTEEAMAARREREKRRLARRLAELAAGRGLDRADARSAFGARRVPAPDFPDGFRIELRLHGEPIPPAEDVQQLLDSIVQDFGDVPAEYLAPAGHGAYRPGTGAPGNEAAAAQAPSDVYSYDEWDYVRSQYRKGWCLLREKDVHPRRDEFVRITREKYRGLLKHLYRTFEALRGEDRLLKGQPFGDDVDIDAAVTAHADRRAGLEPTERLFLKKHKVDRDVATMFLVDMSGSTKGWINDLEREALVLLCEALEILGDRYAVYGFSGFTHQRCELFRIKRLDEPYSDDVRARISAIAPKDYTRMGVAIRHLTRLLAQVEARTKLLITLSDGRPDDQDGYRGPYGIEDTRRALIEARHRGVHPYCITIDDEAMDYLPRMYGPAGFTVVSEVHKLPYKVSDIYRRITM